MLKIDFLAQQFSTMQATQKFSAIYDRLNGQPHLQELIQDFYYEGLKLTQQANEAFKLNNLNLKAIFLGQHLLANNFYHSYEEDGNIGKDILEEYRSNVPEAGALSWQHYRDSSALNDVLVGMLETIIGKGILNID